METIKIKAQTISAPSVATAKMIKRILESVGVKAELAISITSAKRDCKLIELPLSTREKNVCRNAWEAHAPFPFEDATIEMFVGSVPKEDFLKAPNAGKVMMRTINYLFANHGYDWE